MVLSLSDISLYLSSFTKFEWECVRGVLDQGRGTGIKEGILKEKRKAVSGRRGCDQ